MKKRQKSFAKALINKLIAGILVFVHFKGKYALVHIFVVALTQKVAAHQLQCHSGVPVIFAELVIF